jgi:hypothetical protein
MNNDQNQYMPFLFEGMKDDSIVYDLMKKVTTPDYIIDKEFYSTYK